MASTLISKAPKGSTLHVYDISKGSIKRLYEKHPDTVEICASPREVANKTDIAITMLPEGANVRTVYLNPETGILNPAISARLLVDCSTIDVETSKSVGAEVKRTCPGSSFYDAPVSGGTLGAEVGTLTFMLGCADDGSDAQWPLLYDLTQRMGKASIACGGASMDLMAKLCNNYCSGLIALATAEAMDLGIRGGIDPRVLYQIFSGSTAQSKQGDDWNPVPGIRPQAPSSNGYKGGIKVQLMAKDFGLAMKAARKTGAKALLGEVGHQTYVGASKDPRCRDLDSRVVYRYIGGHEDWDKKASL
ncbi:hypothetical protein LCI18_004590 [Fusarium solani-melongenae]|uniref:Uncharacterized protein n=1 Tax=Fusarium solani subsp. cucurbitae TaxID=2747967 RepID=A0ACD3YXR2_FUSSC|nr:hypothetical protein LCI18_004590 [Fusarium solani-melongenae]